MFNEEVVLITGTIRPVGVALARRFHAAGARVVIHYSRSSERAPALASELEDQRERSVHLVRRQLGTRQDAQYLMTHTLRAWGRLDVLVNHSSRCAATTLGSLHEAEVDELLRDNYLTPLYVSQAAAPYLQQHGGSIVNLLEQRTAGELHDHTVYHASMAALTSLTQTLALELAPEVRVNAVYSAVLHGSMTDALPARPDTPAGSSATRSEPAAAPPVQPVADAVAATVVDLCNPACQDSGCLLPVPGQGSERR